MEKTVLIPTRCFSKSDYSSFTIVGDVGGTSTTIAIMGVKSNKRFEIIFKHTYLTKDIDFFENTLNQVLKEAKEEYDIEISTACLAAAGPLNKSRTYIQLTNSDKIIDISKIIKNTLLAEIMLVNDFEAVGFGLDTVDLETDVITLNPDSSIQPDAKDTFAALGPGTGLGVSIAYYDPLKELHVPLPSEGCHMDFPPSNELEVELMWFIKKRKQLDPKNHQPVMEDVLSGRGMENIYDFLSTKYHRTPLSNIIAGLSGTSKLDMIRVNYERDGQCKKTVDMFMTFYGRAARNIALASCSYSGIFLVGNVSLKYTDQLKNGFFLSEFKKHDRASDFLKNIPIYIVKNPSIALYGCCNAVVNFLSIAEK